MKVLVTGASGFVGSALCRAIRPAGIDLYAAVRSPVQAQTLPADVTAVMVDDLIDLAQRSEVLAEMDCIIHLAARVHVMRDRIADPLAAFRAVNTTATVKLATAAVQCGVKRFIYLSSIKVNGEGQADCPSAETKTYSELTKPAPADPYGMSKWEAECQLQQVAVETGLEVVVIRPPLVYGPTVKANFLQLIKLVQRGVPLPFGQVENARSLVFVENLADAILTCVTHPQAAGQTFLVSDGEDVSTPELIRHLAIALGCEARLWPIPMAGLRLAGLLTGKSAAIARLLGSLTVDNRKICQILDWQPPFSLEQGLASTARWYLHS
jgi:UDP-4-keto-D-QuiNAc 4-reductase